MTLAGHYVARGLRLWVLARLLVATALATLALTGGRAAAVAPRDLLILAPAAALLVVPLTALLGVVDVARRHERALLGNLGVSGRRLVAWFALPAAAGELAVGLVAAVAMGLAR